MKLYLQRLCWWEVWLCVGILGWLIWCMVACASPRNNSDSDLTDTDKELIQLWRTEHP